MKPAPRDVAVFLSDAEEIEHRALPGYARITLYLLVALVVCVFLWATFSQIDRVVVARGKLVSTGSTIVAQPVSTSVVRKLNVKAGQVVRKGEVLGVFDPTFTAAEEASLKEQLSTLQAQIARLEAEMDGVESFEPAENGEVWRTQKRLFRERQAHLKASLSNLKERISRLHAAKAATESSRLILMQRLASVSEIEQMRQRMADKGTESRLHLLMARDDRLLLQSDLKNAVNRAEELNHEIAIAESDETTFIADWRQKAMAQLAQARTERSVAEEQLNKAQRLTELSEMVSPADAVVLEVAKVSVGSVVREAEPVVTLVPLDQPLEGEIEIQAKDIGYVRREDPVKLKIDAFPFQKHGALEGELRVISEDAFTHREGPLAGSTFYRGLVELKTTTLKKVPENTRFLPGMTVTAEVVVGTRSVISYFIYPLIRSLDESLHEP